jgi:hypothetical protein
MSQNPADEASLSSEEIEARKQARIAEFKFRRKEAESKIATLEKTQDQAEEQKSSDETDDAEKQKLSKELEALRNSVSAIEPPKLEAPDSTFDVDGNAIFPAQVEVYKSLKRAAAVIGEYLQDKTRGVANKFIVADESLAQNLSLYNSISAELESLDTRLSEVLKLPTSSRQTEGDELTSAEKATLESISSGQVNLVAGAGVVIAAEGAITALETVAAIVNYLRPKVNIKGHKIEIETTTLVAMILEYWYETKEEYIRKHTKSVEEIQKYNLERYDDAIVIPSFALARRSPGESNLLRKVETLSGKIRQLENSNKADKKTLEEAQAFLATLSKQADKGQQSILTNLLAVEPVVKYLDEEANFLLVLRIEAAGGASLKREHLFEKELFYQGGVIITCLLINKSGKIKYVKTVIEDGGFVEKPLRPNSETKNY